MYAVIVVSSLFNLMQAIQIRRTVHKNDKFDIVLCSSQSKIKEIYDNGTLNSIFDNVYYLEEKHYYRTYGFKEGILDFWFPGVHLKHMLNTKHIPKWDSVFMWNPVSFIYCYYRYAYFMRIKINYHMYADAGGGYRVSTLDLRTLLQNGILRYIDKIFFGFNEKCIAPIDYYIFSPELYCGGNEIKLIEIPQYRSDDVEILNRVFKLPKNNIFPDILFLDGPYDGNNMEIEFTRDLIDTISKSSLKKKVGIRPHPRTDISIYNRFNASIYDCKIPFELLCLNSDLRGCIFISNGSSSSYMPHILFGVNNPIIWYVCTLDDATETFILKLKSKMPNLYVVYNESELCDVLHILISSII